MIGEELRVQTLYTPLEEAVEELHRRRTDGGLCRAVAEFQRTHLPEFLDGEPNAFFVRPVFSADLEFERFAALSRKAELTPLCLEISKDRFASFNREKYRRGKLTFCWPNRTRALRVMDFNHDGKRFDEIPSLNGCSLVEFHHRLLAHAHPELANRVRDVSDWIFAASRIPPRYLHLLSLAITDGVLFENFFLDDPEERRFMEERILPSFARAIELFGVKPLIVRLFTPEEENEPWLWQYPGGLYSFARDLLNGGSVKPGGRGSRRAAESSLMEKSARREPRPPGNENGHSFSWQHPKLEVRDTERYGKGIFACGSLECGEVLFVIGGSILTCAEEACLPSALLHMPIEISERFSIGPRSAADLERMPQHYVNHSCDPNAGFQGQMLIMAMRTIRSGEEITYDYAMCLRPEDEMPFRMECRCGSRNCRGVITGEDWKQPELHRRYAGHFQWYLQEKINGLTPSPQRAQRTTT